MPGPAGEHERPEPHVPSHRAAAVGRAVSCDEKVPGIFAGGEAVPGAVLIIKRASPERSFAPGTTKKGEDKYLKIFCTLL